MALRNAQYDRILREYDRRRLANRREEVRRREEVFAQIPGFEELVDALPSATLSSVRSLFSEPKGPDSYEAGNVLSALREQSEEIADRKHELLTSYGFPADYLDPIYTCPDCQDTGFVDGEKCHCFKKAVVDLVYAQSELKDILQKENFAHFSERYYDDTVVDEATGLTPLENIREVKEMCLSFVRHFDDRPGNLYFYGNTGVGKTFLCHCIAKELLDAAHTVIYFSAPALFDVFETLQFDRRSEDYALREEQLGYLFESDLLIIDDLGTEVPNSFIASCLLECMERRSAAGLSTVISSNYPLSEIRRLYSERVYSRLARDYTIIKVSGSDIRTKQALED
ncbi:MAG: ATP-binding protein [Lachnospiraceae bacterium]|nr:ATP-binding protein [Lachnospiraceae bacterium]